MSISAQLGSAQLPSPCSVAVPMVDLEDQQFPHFPVQNRQKKAQSSMIREYSFPNIFKNIVGDIIPAHALCRVNHPFRPRLGTHTNLSDQPSIALTYQSDNHSLKNNLIGIKSQQKKILSRRQKPTTNFEFGSQSVKTNTYKVPSRENEKHVNFLRKNSNNLTSNASRTFRSQEDESLASKQSEVNIQVSLTDICSEKWTPPSKRNAYRIRTSIDEPILLDRIAEEEGDLLQTNKKQNYRKSKLSRVPFTPHQTRQSTTRIPQSKGKPSKNSINNSEPPSEPRIRLQSKKRVLKQGFISNQKKTVNFSQRASISNNNTRKPFNSRNQSVSKYSNRLGKSPGLSRFKFSHPSQSESSDDKSQSQWTAKSVISIKFYDDDGKETVKRAQKQKSIRSKDSILQSHSNMKVKPFMKMTKTVKFIRQNEGFKLDRPYKSQHTISVKSKYNSKYKQSKFMLKRKKTGKSECQNGSEVKINVKVKKGPAGRGSILKKLQPIGFTFSSVRNLNIPVQTYSFQDIVIKRSCMGLRKTMLKAQKQQINVYDELNTFLQFISEEDQLQTQREIQPTLNKPIIIPEEIHHREINNNQELFNNQNQIIDLGLKLVKKMNKLTQKKY